MKKTLLSVLLLVASAIMAQAQGFRVIKSDGTVYQFSWVADRIEFYEVDGDPNWVEPIPDEVKDAIATLQSACATNAARINQIQANLDENKAAVINVVKDLADINEQLSDRINALAQSVTGNTGKIERNTTNIERNTADIATIGEQVGWCQYTVGEHDEAIKQIESFEKGYFERVRNGEQTQQFLSVGSMMMCSFLRSLLAAENIPTYTENEHVNSMYSLNALSGNSAFSSRRRQNPG